MNPPESNDRESERRGVRGRIADVGPVWISAIGTLIAALAAALGLFLTNTSDNNSGPSDSATSPSESSLLRAPLSPASDPPQIDECRTQLSVGADGNVSPLFCSNGDLNVLAWEHVAKTNPLVLSLGPNVLPDQVLRAMCSDLRNSTIPVVVSSYQLAQAYYGWDFGIDPSQELEANGAAICNYP